VSDLRAVCFDLDDTLRDSSGTREALLRTCERLGVLTGLDPADLLACNSRVWPPLWVEVEDAWTLGGMSGEAVTTEAWRQTLEACGYASSETALQAAAIHLEEVFGVQRLFDDAKSLLDAIDPELRLAVITNGASDTQRAVLRALGIEDQFRAVIVSGEVGVAKPDPHIFELALNALGVSAEQAWHVGDNPFVDVAGARAAGLTAVWLNRAGITPSYGAPEPDMEVRSLVELLPHL
jgi:putative hydrolase of the HAD superfamily